MNILITFLTIVGIAKIIELLLSKYLNKETDEVKLDADKFKSYKDQIVFLNEEMDRLTERIKEKQSEFEALAFQLNCKLCDLESRLNEEQSKNRELEHLICFSINCTNRQYNKQ